MGFHDSVKRLLGQKPPPSKKAIELGNSLGGILMSAYKKESEIECKKCGRFKTKHFGCIEKCPNCGANIKIIKETT